jgi:hypothetical protein
MSEKVPVATRRTVDPKQAEAAMGITRPRRPFSSAPESETAGPAPAEFVIPVGRLGELRGIAKDISEDHIAIGQLEEQIFALQTQKGTLLGRVQSSRRKFDEVQNLALLDAGVPSEAEVLSLDLQEGRYLVNAQTIAKE